MQPLFVIIILALMVLALIKDRMRPGLIMFSGAVVFLCAGILTPKELLEGFANKGMITVAMLFLVSEGVRRSGLLEALLRSLLPLKSHTAVRKVQARMLPTIAFISAFLNNTPVVVIFAPMIKRWAEKHGVAATKLLIPLSYATILGGTCTLIGTSTNLVVHGMVIDAGFEGFSMFELGMWNPGLIKLKHINDSIRAIDIDLHLPALFKFTLGSWKYEAGFENSYYGDNLEINNAERKNYRYILTEWMNIEDDENQ